MANRYEAPDEIRLQLLDSSDLMRDRGITLTHDLQGGPDYTGNEPTGGA